MEYFDILDKEGKPTGRKATREEAHSKGLWHRVAHIWIVNSKGEILIQKRTPNKDSYPNMWGMSCEGHIASGQNLKEGALRELKEELGLMIKPNQLQLIFSYARSNRYHNGFVGNHFIDVYIIKLDIETQQLSIQEEEVAELKWLRLEEYIDEVKQKNPSFRDYPEELPRLAKLI